MKKTIYEYKATTWDDKELNLSDYSGKTVLIVNTASECGFTPQYKGLQELYEKYQEKGFEILAFPCDQFAHQEPGSNEEIHSFCTRTFRTTFPILSKIEVNGPNAHPLYKFLTAAKHGFLGSKKIKWNFTKFLVDKNGYVIKRYASTVKPENIASDIEKII